MELHEFYELAKKARGKDFPNLRQLCGKTNIEFWLWCCENEKIDYPRGLFVPHYKDQLQYSFSASPVFYTRILAGECGGPMLNESEAKEKGWL